MRTFSISAGLAASTVTPGSTAPEESLTVPAMTACADAADGIKHDPRESPRLLTTTRISHLAVRLFFASGQTVRPRLFVCRPYGFFVLRLVYARASPVSRLNAWIRGARSHAIQKARDWDCGRCWLRISTARAPGGEYVGPAEAGPYVRGHGPAEGG